MSADRQAQEASARYDEFCTMVDAAVFNSVTQCADTGVFTSPMVKVNLIRDRYIAGEIERTAQMASEIHMEVSEAVSGHYGSVNDSEMPPMPAIDTLRVALSLQAQKIASSAEASVNQFRMNVVNGKKVGSSVSQAARNAASLVTGADRNFSDRRGKEWKGNVYVRTLWRQAYIWSEASSVMFMVADHKKSLAVIEHPEESHASNGIIISVTGADGYPTWEQVRDKHFHPNSRAKLKPYGD